MSPVFAVLDAPTQIVVLALAIGVGGGFLVGGICLLWLRDQIDEFRARLDANPATPGPGRGEAPYATKADLAELGERAEALSGTVDAVSKFGLINHKEIAEHRRSLDAIDARLGNAEGAVRAVDPKLETLWACIRQRATPDQLDALSRDLDARLDKAERMARAELEAVSRDLELKLSGVKSAIPARSDLLSLADEHANLSAAYCRLAGPEPGEAPAPRIADLDDDHA